jgi:plasmid stability protein
MPTLVIKSFPESLHARLRSVAAAHRRSVTQETIHLLEQALLSEGDAVRPGAGGGSKWAARKVSAEYEAMMASGAFSGGVDSGEAVSEERDAR